MTYETRKYHTCTLPSFDKTPELSDKGIKRQINTYLTYRRQLFHVEHSVPSKHTIVPRGTF